MTNANIERINELKAHNERLNRWKNVFIDNTEKLRDINEMIYNNCIEIMELEAK